ncbi:S8 family serine peptidase [Phytohabitans sp. ZYX-F-186]|uniref:S8 family serine peptidase n=1 Tax=Phytohabitans maris TaxID=3071409 RepID=A0ABU0ZHM3_9ACTN|nr:S8 family serine peptidase [Phytohabitans sp. ZYX-F-186]MDQ7906559.1 S8 family serine peptidase [Phytohabitans sp. ZYX-F-186]
MALARTTAVVCVAAAMCAVGAAPAAAAPRAPAPTNQRCVEPGPTIAEVPWAQRMLGPERVRPFTRGGGQIIAVLDSGVDAGHPELGGRVLAGFDAVAGSGPANDDCLGTGTQVAGVIGAKQEQSVGFVGLAPDVTILPIRVIAERPGSGNAADPQVLARGIDEAVRRGASVVAVTTITYQDSPLLQGAVANAISKGVPVVAAVGDLGDQRGVIPTPYPAAYDDVVGVGAIRESGVLWGKSQQGEYVDVVAPGEKVLTLSRAGGMTVADGTALATGFAAATAVLVRSRRGMMQAQGGIGRQIERTAVPAPGGAGYGSGVVDPYAAVTARLAATSPEPLPGLPPLSTEESPAWARARDLAMIGTGVAVAAVLVVLAFAVVMPRGRRRFWRPAMAPKPHQETEPDEPGPPVQLFP